MTIPDQDRLQSWARSPGPRRGEVEARTGRDWPTVTLVTPSLNQSSYLEQALNSVLAQDYPGLEYIVIDGGSTDESPSILKRYNERLAHWESAPDEGQAQAINKGWRKGSGRYLWWLNADDMLTPDSLFTSVVFLEQNPEVDLVYGDVIRLDGDSQIIDRFDYPDFSFEEFVINGRDISQAGALMRGSWVDRIGYLNEDLHYLMDKEFWLRIALAGGEIAHLGSPLALFRIHTEAKTQRGSEIAAREHLAVTRWLLEHDRCPGGIHVRRGRVLGRSHLSAARSLVKAGSYRAALDQLWHTLRFDQAALAGFGFWHNALLAAAGLVLGEGSLNRLRSWLRSHTRSRTI